MTKVKDIMNNGGCCGHRGAAWYNSIKISLQLREILVKVHTSTPSKQFFVFLLSYKLAALSYHPFIICSQAAGGSARRWRKQTVR